MMRFLAIARNAFIETIRQPIYFVLITVTFALLVLSLALPSWSMGRGQAEYRETDQLNLIVWGLSTLLGSGMLVAAFSAAGVLSREIEEKTVLTVLSKPVSRAVVVLGKYGGVVAAVVVAFYVCSMVFLMTVRHRVMPTAADPYDWVVILLGCLALLLALGCAGAGNYWFGWRFTSALVAFEAVFLTLAMLIICKVGKGWVVVPFGQGISSDVLVAMLLILLGSLVFAAVAVAASTRLGQMMTLAVCVGFSVVGLWSYYLFGRLSETNVFARIAYWIWPNMTYFQAMDGIVNNHPVPLYYAGMVAVYAACQIAAILAIGVALFQTRELEAEAASSAPRLVSLLAWGWRINALGAAIMAMRVAGNFDSLLGVLIATGLAATAVAMWAFGRYIGRGAKWAYFAAAGIGVVAAGGGVFRLATGRAASTSATITAIAVGGAMLLILALPKTRHHFGFGPGAVGAPVQ